MPDRAVRARRILYLTITIGVSFGVLLSAVVLGSLYNRLFYLGLIGLPPLAWACFAAYRNIQEEQLLSRLRSSWGEPVDRVRNFLGLAQLYDRFAERFPADGSIDERAWHDLELDRLFCARR